MQFYPPNAHVPDMLQADEFTLCPLMPAHVKLDHAALMSSKAMLRLWSGHPEGGWPQDDFSIDDNMADMEWHYSDHLARTAFTFTVLNPAEDEALGCIYIVPFKPLMDSNPHLAGKIQDDAALVRFWVVESLLADGLDQRLLKELIAWFAEEWSFNQIYFHTFENHEQQIGTLESCGLTNVGQIVLDGRGRFHLYS